MIGHTAGIVTNQFLKEKDSDMEKIIEGLFELPGKSTTGHLIGSKCGSCQTISFPKRKICPQCLEQEKISVIPLSRCGSLYSFSINQVAPEGFNAPYITGRIDLPENVRIFSVITDCEPDIKYLEIGMDMTLVFEPLRRNAAGIDLYSYKFRPTQQNPG